MRYYIIVVLIIAMAFISGCDLNSPPEPIADNPLDPENPFPPRAPENFKGDPTSETSVSLEWRDMSGNEDGFRLVISRLGNIPVVEEHIYGTDTNSVIIDGLWKNSSYQCQLIAFNEAGDSEVIPTISISTSRVKPTPPRDLSVRSISATEVSLTWLDMSENESGFYIMISVDDSSDFELFGDLAPNESEIIFLNVLETFTTYFFRISAHNTFGISPHEGMVWVTPGSSPPETPHNFTAQAVSESEVDLSWLDESDNTEDIVIFMGTNDSLNLDQEFFIDSNLNSYTFTELPPNSNFYFRIRAQNRFSLSDLSPMVSASTSSVPPTSPSNLIAESSSETSIVLSWSDESSIETAYQMEQSYLNTEDYQVIGTTGVDVEEMMVENLDREATYFYRVRARGVYGSSPWSDVIQVVTSSLPPAAPDSLIGEIVSPTEISLTWMDNSNIERAFSLYRSVNSNSNWMLLERLPANLLTINDTDLDQNTRYFYKIRATNEYGVSEFSNVIELRTPYIPPAPTGLTATGISATEIEIVWNDRSDNEVGFLLEEQIEDGGWRPILDVNADVERYTVSSRIQLTKYEYRIYAFNEWGESDYSNTDSATPYTLIAFVACSEAGMIVVNITDPSSPEALIELNTPGNAMHIEINGDYAYIADSYAGVRVIDISDPREPEEIANFDTDGQARSLVIENQFAYVADDDNGMIILDISSPANPQQIGRYHSEGLEVFDVSVDGRIAYLAAEAAGIIKVDISNHRSPVFSEELDTYGAAFGIKIMDGYGYVADYSGGMSVIDLSDFSIVGFDRAPSNALQIMVRGGYAYIANYRNGLSIIDITSPDDPEQVASINTPDEARGVTLHGDYALISDYGGGLRIIDISVPPDPDEIGSIQLPGRAQDSAVKVYR